MGDMKTKQKKHTDIPTMAIEWIVNRFHVGTPDEEIATDIRRRVRSVPEVSPALEKKMVNYALKQHHKNQGLYHSVMTGRL
jgi:hypothetical protein